ncbi:Ncapd2 [Symbiodinium necroappetens]|uniref:Ncapd2 protein n=1 Tax=Symbiodinium necroappetens TaxID=1628268 RepID=A0A812UFZ5_9DINO|nr:Ncapd2 [Symbiodinium necroappetens]
MLLPKQITKAALELQRNYSPFTHTAMPDLENVVKEALRRKWLRSSSDGLRPSNFGSNSSRKPAPIGPLAPGAYPAQAAGGFQTAQREQQSWKHQASSETSNDGQERSADGQDSVGVDPLQKQDVSGLLNELMLLFPTGMRFSALKEHLKASNDGHFSENSFLCPTIVPGPERPKPNVQRFESSRLMSTKDFQRRWSMEAVGAIKFGMHHTLHPLVVTVDSEVLKAEAIVAVGEGVVSLLLAFAARPRPSIGDLSTADAETPVVPECGKPAHHYCDVAMREFTLPFKPEELLAEPSDGRLWASELPCVESWSEKEVNKALDGLVGRLLGSQGKDLAEESMFSLLFAILQAWPRLDDSIPPRVVDLLTDSARRLIAEAGKVRKGAKPAKVDKAAEAQSKDLRNASKVAAFFLRWTTEYLMQQGTTESRKGRGRGRGAKAGTALQQAEQAAAAEEAKEAMRAQERQRCAVLQELAGLVNRGAMPWLWLSEPASWQQAATAVSDAGFYVLDSTEALKSRETRQMALQCIVAPLLQEGQQHSNLLVATVSKLIHGLRVGEGTATFTAECLLQAHTTPLPRLFLVDLTQHCGQELTAQGAFQRSLAAFLVALAERLPHVVLANISVLLPLLDVDCYPIRQAIVESMGHLLSAEGRKLPRGAHSVQPAAEDAEEATEEIVQSSSGTFSLAAATKTDLLETLFTRSLDKSVWVRYRVLQTLTGLASNSRLPREQWPRVLDLAIRRMQDTASMSRKAAMQLVRTLVEFHPYGPALKGTGDERAKAEKLLTEIHERLKKLKAEELAELEGKEEEEEGEEDGTDEPQEQPEKRRRVKGKTETEVSIAREVDKDLSAEISSDDARKESRQKQREALLRMQECYAQRVQFVELLDSAETRLRSLLTSKTPTDVTEAIGVVVELRLRGVPAAARAFHQVLGLVWSRHAPIKDAAVDAFYRMHLEGRDAASAATAILHIYRDGHAAGSLTHTHLASVQELIQQAADKELVSARDVMPTLLASLTEPSMSAFALRAITALVPSTAGHSSVSAALPKLKEFITQQKAGSAEDRLESLRLVCQLLMRFQSSSKTPLQQQVCATLHDISQQGLLIVVQHFVSGEIPAHWFGAAQASMDLSFELAALGKSAVDAAHRSPDKVWENILNRMLCGLLGGSQSSASEAEAAEGKPEELVRQISVPQLGCVAFIAGHLALRMLIFLEGLQSALKRKRLAQEEAKMAEQREKSKEKKAVGKKGKAQKVDEEEEEKNTEASMGGVGQEEREAEAFAQLAENGLLYSTNRLLDRVKPLLFACLLNKDLRMYPLIRRVGAISLCKFMTVSKRFCQENLQLLFSVLFPKSGKGQLSGAAAEDAVMGPGGLLEDLTLRQSLLVAVGDLLFRHPNVVEPWTGRLYATLTSTVDSSEEGGQSACDLRLTALLVLTHLVLNDMMKPRPVLLIRALWLTACSHEATARVARILFQELSKRSTNVVYNLLPEIVARLPEHVAEVGVEGGATGRVQYIMQFVEKEKHIEGLIEKFSLRLEQCAGGSGAHTEPTATQAEPEMEVEEAGPVRVEDTISCLAHALGAMNYSDRCILRLHDVVVVRKALNLSLSYHAVVRDCILGVVEKARKPRQGKEKGESAPAEPDAVAAEGGGGGAKGASTAAASALDALEQLINTLANGKDESKEEAPAVAVRKPGNLPGKKKQADTNAEPGFEEPEKKERSGKGRGKGRGKARVAGKENLPGNGVPNKGRKRKTEKARADDDDEDYE